ncbi:MAG: beta-N-acetylhexosaminidase [Candidatus Hodarchaeales archaeon]
MKITNRASQGNFNNCEVADLLIPHPQQLVVKNDYITISKEVNILLNCSNDRVLNILKFFQKELRKKGIFCVKNDLSRENCINNTIIELNIINSLFRLPQSYRITIDGTGLTIIGSDDSGLFYGIQTLLQLIDICYYMSWTSNESLKLPCMLVNDWPDFPHRGVMIDISRDKVPTLETLFDLIDLLSKWKINHLQLYMEHTFAYQGHEQVWKDSSPLTGEDVQALDCFCQERYIELVPNQNSFGHFHRWLVHGPYRNLAECPEGVDHPFSLKKEPYSLCPIDPGSIELLKDLYNQLLPNFNSHQFNVGLDETFDLGTGRSMEICSKKGRIQVYLDFLKIIHTEVTKRGKVMLFWADIILEFPEMIKELPQDVIPLIWGYEAEYPFDKFSKLLNKNGLSYYVCPGTSSWNSFAGRTDNTVKNLQNAAISGKKNNAVGYIITDWGDNGHLQPLPVSYLGFLIGAGVSWNSDSKLNDISILLNVHVFKDKVSAIGKIVYELGNLYNQIGYSIPNNSVLFLILLFPNHPLIELFLEEISYEKFENLLAQIEKMKNLLQTVRLERNDAELIVNEFQWVADILKLSCELGLAWKSAGSNVAINQLPIDKKIMLSDRLVLLIDQYQEIWFSRNRPGGLNRSISRFKRILSMLNT